ncbi:protein rolling stone-like [Aphomia sociella]
MSGVKKYFKEQFQWRNLGLEYSDPPAFYLSVWQTTRSAVPLMIFRGLLFLTSLGIALSSIIIYSINGIFGYWFIYLTHWGLTSNVLATGFATAVSARCYIYGPISTKYRIPWYMKTYWVLFNVATPVAFLITVFYWTVLYEAGIEEELNHGLDIAVHGLNSIVMFLLLVSSSQPSLVVHVCQPLLFALSYFFFSLIYYLAGGVNTKGLPYVYPVLNWQKPGITIAVGCLTGVLLLSLYYVIMGLMAARTPLPSESCNHLSKYISELRRRRRRLRVGHAQAEPHSITPKSPSCCAASPRAGLVALPR